MTRILMILALVFSAVGAFAQSYPEYNSTTVNDYAELLDDASEARVVAQLEALEKDTGIEMTVLTLSSQDMFAPDITLEKFATGLFNEWGIGDKTSNDGVLVLIMKTDRAMRIELGGSYGRDWDRAAARVIDRSFLPAFKEDRYRDGIEAGVTDTINTIVTPFLAGEKPPTGAPNNWVWVIVMAVVGGFGALIFKDKFVKLKRCPECGTRHLNRTRHVKNNATKMSTGDGDVITTCSNCSYRNVVPYTIGRISSSSSKSSFGGGSSGSGGASGKW